MAMYMPNSRNHTSRSHERQCRQYIDSLSFCARHSRFASAESNVTNPFGSHQLNAIRQCGRVGGVAVCFHCMNELNVHAVWSVVINVLWMCVKHLYAIHIFNYYYDCWLIFVVYSTHTRARTHHFTRFFCLASCFCWSLYSLLSVARFVRSPLPKSEENTPKEANRLQFSKTKAKNP